MDLPPISDLAPLFSEKAGIAALFGLAIWAGVRLVAVGIAAFRDVELARTTVQKALAEAIQAQASAALALAQAQTEARRAAEEQTIVLRMIAGRVGFAGHELHAQTGEGP
ncbi:hypothetical protein [uncultured Thiodictyon sp.]|uniref:hypothetical protein n=1 Tax=uncultured Thiodictyon sp. TaxID=1846217 RepID=UPI0025FDCB67|nr:hypothetical protein [uncultured Thiodictyon sp.]